MTLSYNVEVQMFELFILYFCESILVLKCNNGYTCIGESRLTMVVTHHKCLSDHATQSSVVWKIAPLTEPCHANFLAQLHLL